MRKINELKIRKEGFTLIEMLVVMSIFIVLIGVITGIFITGIKQQRNILAYQSVLDQTSYALEYMSRSLRLAKKELSAGTCLSQYGLNYEITDIQPGYPGLKFINVLEYNDCQAFFVKDGQLKYQKDLDISPSPPPLNLTSNKIRVTSLKFDLEGESQADDPPLQPRVTIFLEIGSETSPGQWQKIKIQTSISQRNLDVLY